MPEWKSKPKLVSSKCNDFKAAHHLLYAHNMKTADSHNLAYFVWEWHLIKLSILLECNFATSWELWKDSFGCMNDKCISHIRRHFPLNDAYSTFSRQRARIICFHFLRFVSFRTFSFLFCSIFPQFPWSSLSVFRFPSILHSFSSLFTISSFVLKISFHFP